MLRQALDQYAATLNRQWSHDRSKSVGASEIGQCARKTFAVKNEGTHKAMPRDADWTDQYGARVRGVIMESAFWEPAMRARFGDNLLFAGQHQTTLRSGYLSATPDALVVNQPPDVLKSLGIADIESDCFAAEAKSIDPRTNLLEAKVENVFQVHTQLGLIREQTEHKPVYSVLTYTDASFWSEVTEYPIKFDPAIYQAAKDRATVIMTADKPVELPPEGWIAGGKECSFCPFVTACGVERRSVPPNNKAATPQFIAEITDMCTEANRAELTSEIAKSRYREIEQQIKDRLREKGVRRIQGVVNWFEVAGAVRYGAKGMKEALLSMGEDVEQFATQGLPSDRLVIAASPAVPSPGAMPGKLKPKPKAKSNGNKRKTANGNGNGNGRRKTSRPTAKPKSRTGQSGKRSVR